MDNNLEILDRSIYFYLVVCILIFSIFTITQINMTKLLEENNKAIIKLDSFISPQKKDGMKYKRLSKEDPHLYTFKTTITEAELTSLHSDNYEMMVYQFAAQWYKIYFNGMLIGSSGNYQNANSNIWNEFAKYSIPQNIIKEENQVFVKAYSSYEIGTLSTPLMISHVGFSSRIYDWFNLFFNSSYIIMMGIVLINLLLLGFITNINSLVKNEYIYYILANLFLIPAIFDYLTIYNLPVSLLLFKKIMIISNCGVALFISYGLYKRFEKKIILVTSSLLLAITLFGIFCFSNIIDFVNYWGVVNAAILINVLAWLYTTIYNLKKSYIAKVMFFTSIFALYDPINIIILSYFNINLGITANRFLIFPLAFILITIYHYMELDRTVVYEQTKSELMYQRAIRDEMTDTYNHQYIVELLENKGPAYSIVMLDIDDFKKINDQYGHQTGDFVINYVVEEIKDNIRQNDIIGRYGGDEFIVILDSCKQEKAKQIAKKIKGNIKKTHQTPGGQKVKVTVSVGVYYVEEEEDRKEILKEVDHNLYQAKELGKDKVIAG